jgi:hypothetical protein
VHAKLIAYEEALNLPTSHCKALKNNSHVELDEVENFIYDEITSYR